MLLVIFSFPGYLFLTLLTSLPTDLRALLAMPFAIVSVTTAYDLFSRTSQSPWFTYFAVALSVAGMTLCVLQIRRAPALPGGQAPHGAFVAGGVVALCVAPLFWRSGRFSAGEFVFYGPAGQDPLFHVSLLQRLMQHVPPDNFMVSGIRAPVYHYFDDLTLAFTLHAQTALHLGAADPLDLFYRCYPIFVYFLLGALTYRTGRILLSTRSGGILSVLLLLGAGGLGCFFGALRTAFHASHFTAMRESLFSDWASWDGVDAIRPLVHRPAHYHGLLICLAAINLLLQPRRSRRDWILAGLLLGLMAGFNFTLAATFGISAVIGCVILFSQRRRHEAHDLAWFALSIFMGSLPVTSAMLLSGFHSVAAGFPFRGPNLELSAGIWGSLLGRFTPAALVPGASLVVLIATSYGVKLFGVGAMVRFDLGDLRHRSVALVLAIVFALSFVVGMFFPYQGVGGIAVVFLQPTLWILGLFSLRPIHAWLERNQESWRPAVLWGVLGVTFVQALLAFNFSSKAAFSRDTASALQEIRTESSPDDVVAYLPSELTERPIFGPAEVSTNYSITALTGLDGYFSTETYSLSFAVPGMSGSDPAEVLAQAKKLYQQRRDDVASFVKSGTNQATSERLAKDHVRWIIVSGDALSDIRSSATVWRKTSEIAIYQLSR